ncbi:MAG: AMP-binding protein [Bacillota bacterium]|nr:AMP-binding protein [Bacillota bacterium]
MENGSNLPQRLKGLRSELGISVAEMARATELSEREYLEIENGVADVGFTVLYKCANKFGVDLASLVTGDEPRLTSYTLSRQGEGMPIKRLEAFEYVHIAYLLKNRLSEPFIVTAKYSEKLENSPIELTSHNGEELDYVLEGTLKVQIDDHIEILQPGDSVYYEGRKRHGLVAVGGKDCKFLAVVIRENLGDQVEPLGEPPVLEAPQPRADRRIYTQYVNEALDENGSLTGMSYNIPDNFNFAYDVVDALARRSPDKLAMLWVSARGEERRFTFSDMAEASNRAANYFAGLGVKKGDRVMLVLRRHYQFWYAILALHKLGAIAIPATDQLTTKDFAYRFNAGKVDAVVCTAQGHAAEMAEEALAQSPTVKIKSIANGEREGWDSFDKGIEAASPVFPRVDTGKYEPMLMYFTSGTAAYPKMASHNYTYPLGHVVTAKWWHNVREDGLHFTVADTGWGKAVWGKLYGQWLCEAAVFTCDFDKFDPADILPMFKKYDITTFCAPPTVFRFFIKEDLSKYDLSSLQHVCTAGEALNPEVFQQFYKATGLRIMEGFGQTETTLTVLHLLGMESRPGSMGKPSPAYQVCLLGPDGKKVRSGQVGEICLSTENGFPIGMASGYYLDEEKTREAWHDGYYHSGDTAWQDEDGYFWYVGRTDDLIKSSGYRIGPFEIESVLMEMPQVLECAVTGVPDEIRGQLVKATIILAKGCQPSDALVKEIQEYVKTHTAPYKYPRVVEFVDQLPKTISGKIRRVELRERSAQEQKSK